MVIDDLDEPVAGRWCYACYPKRFHMASERCPEEDACADCGTFYGQFMKVGEFWYCHQCRPSEADHEDTDR